LNVAERYIIELVKYKKYLAFIQRRIIVTVTVFSDFSNSFDDYDFYEKY